MGGRVSRGGVEVEFEVEIERWDAAKRARARHHARARASLDHRRRWNHSFARAFDEHPTLLSRDRVRRRIASPRARSRPRARVDTATHTRVNFQSTRARDRRLTRRVASHTPRASSSRGPPSRSTHPFASRANVVGRIVFVVRRRRHAPLVLVSSARVTITARALRRCCVRVATRARCVVVVVAPIVIARIVIVECRRVSRSRGRGRIERERAVEGLVCGSCLVDRSRDSCVGRVSSIGPRVGGVSRDRSMCPSPRHAGRSVGRSVGRSPVEGSMDD